MLSAIRQLFSSRDTNSSDQDKSALRAKLIAVAVARATHYTQLSR
jgi:hypothetical protein